jgi:hypothetical protein
MEKVALLHSEPAAAHLPICAEKVVIIENTIFFVGQTPFGDEAIVGDVLLILSSESLFVVTSRYRIKLYLRYIFFLNQDLPESSVAGAKDSPQNAITRPKASRPADA